MASDAFKEKIGEQYIKKSLIDGQQRNQKLPIKKPQ